MLDTRTSLFTFLVGSALVALPGTSHAGRHGAPQVCSLGSAAVGQQGTVICKDTRTGATTQSIPLGNTVAAAGGVGGTLSRRGDHVLVANQAGGAVLFDEDDGRLRNPVTLPTGSEGSLSGTLGQRGAYVVTATQLLFFPRGQHQATSSQPRLAGDGSASQVALAGSYAYVAEKSGSLEAFLLGRDGNIIGPATPVTGIAAGTIVGITGYDDLIVAPVAHLATSFNQAAIPVVNGTTGIQLVATKEVAACWTASEDGQVCVSNPGSMTVSCGRLGPGGFKSYTSAAANPQGDSVFDLDLRNGLVGIQATRAGAPVLQTYARAEHDGDFLTLLGEYPLGTARASGALLLPPLSN